jgi:hypothetical protein
VRTSGIGAVKRPAAVGIVGSLIHAGNAALAQPICVHCGFDHYCIATDQELWFEKLDFDAF